MVSLEISALLIFNRKVNLVSEIIPFMKMQLTRANYAW